MVMVVINRSFCGPDQSDYLSFISLLSSFLQDQALPVRKIPVLIKASAISNGKASPVIAP